MFLQVAAFLAIASGDFSVPPVWLTGGGMGGMVAGLYWGLYKGWLLTGREGNWLREEIKENRATIKEVLSQNSSLIVERDAAVKALDALRTIADRAQHEGTPT